jgi:sirohydrochlorin ferrochelatase
MRAVILLDNGSRRAESTLSLRHLATALTERIRTAVQPVSLLHSSAIDERRLHGIPAQTFEDFLRRQLRAGTRDFTVIPLFFGRSRALTELIPERVAALRSEHGPFDVQVAETLCPLPAGEPRLVEILHDNVRQTVAAIGTEAHRVILVDHGSPLPQVTAVRRVLAEGLRTRLDGRVPLDEAVMERRQGSEYDFNGMLLEDKLREIAQAHGRRPVVLAMLFLSPGRHAGPGGDIEQICRAVTHDDPRMAIYPTALVGANPGLVDILQSRYEASLG